ncbi:hypothetical protein ACP70R_039827 [Stipagrostis hirtigluma subsp. patula]
MAGNSTQECPVVLLEQFAEDMFLQISKVDGLMFLNAVLMAVMVFIGAYFPRYRRHHLIRFIFLGATTLSLPIVSIVAGANGNDQYFKASLVNDQVVAAQCFPGLHIILVFVWTVLVIHIGINTSAVVAGDAREGRNIDPPTELLVKAVWAAYLVAVAISAPQFLANAAYVASLLELPGDFVFLIMSISFMSLCLLTISKIGFKFISFYRAQRSNLHGRSPPFIAAYMAYLVETQVTDQVAEHTVTPPALVVMCEGRAILEKQPDGYSYLDETPVSAQGGDGTRRNNRALVTLDLVWQLDDRLLGPTSKQAEQAKDLCFSFALFKLLRCRFAKYTVSEVGSMMVDKFLRHTYLNGAEYERIFGVIANELSFVHDYYYSSLPLPSSQLRAAFAYSMYQFITLFAFSFVSVVIAATISRLISYDQMVCRVWCPGQPAQQNGHDGTLIGIGATSIDALPVYFVLAAAMCSEIKDIAYYLCSNMAKVALICSCVRHNRWPKCVGFVLRHFRCKWLNKWEDKMSQCSILVPHSQEVSIFYRRLVHLPNQRKIKVPNEVKEAVFKALQDDLASLEEGAIKHIRRPSSPVSDCDDNSLLPWPGAKGTASAILAWHIATSIFEVKDPNPSDHKVVATTLSRYCAYLVGYRPELLPDADEWCKKLYKDVEKDPALHLARFAARAAAPEDRYKQLAETLIAESKQEVLKSGGRLGVKLADTSTTWEELARFWSQMLLYVAPSENSDAHADAIFRGGELITLLWALLLHAGIECRS